MLDPESPIVVLLKIDKSILIGICSDKESRDIRLFRIMQKVSDLGGINIVVRIQVKC